MFPFNNNIRGHGYCREHRVATSLGWEIRRRWEQPPLQTAIVQIIGEGPTQAGLGGLTQVFANSGATNAATGGNLTITQSFSPFKAQDFSDFTHG